MKMKKSIFTLLVTSLLCSGCNTKNTSSSNNEPQLTKIKITNASKEGSVINPNDVIIKNTKHSLDSSMLNNYQYLPSIGDVNILVVPVLLPGYDVIDLDNDGNDDKDKILSDIEKAFFSEELETFESVKSFYKKSSFGKLNISGEVTDWFEVSEETDYKSANEIDYYQTYDLVDKIVNWAKYSLGMDMTKYDNDNDGYIDGIWCIYSCPNYTNGGPQTDYGNYWAYTSWGNQDAKVNRPNVNDPIYNLFGWASYDFMYEGYGINNIDAHTYIHETGHFLGLSDYYSDQMTYNPIGKVDMMDANICDHNSYSKMLLGWTKPYVVTGNATIELDTFDKENSLIVIPSDNEVIENNTFDPFSEYILIEVYSNDELNNYDSLNKYSNGIQGINDKGVRIYHVDNRKFLIDTSNEFNLTCLEYNNEKIDSDHRLATPITNNRGIDFYNEYFNLDINVNLFDEIRMIEATNVDTFSSGGIQKPKSLFKTNDEFSLEKYGKNFFINENKFNNGDTFSYKVLIEEVK